MKEKIETLIKRAGVNPKNINSWGKKGIALFHQKEYERAIKCFDKSLKINPENTGIWLIKSTVFHKLKKCREMRECLLVLLSIKPKDEFDRCNRGIAIAILEHDEKRALECFSEALKINPKDIRSWDNKAFALCGLGRFKEAIECLDEIIKIDPENEDAWLNKGEILALGSSFEGGKKFKGWYRKGPKAFVEAWDNWQPKYEEAMKCYNKVLEINPKNTHVWFEKGFILEDVFGNPKKAIKCYDRILEIEPKNIKAFSYKASILEDIGEKCSSDLFRGTKEERIKIQKEYRDNKDIWFNINGERFFSIKKCEEEKYKEAMKCYDRILEIDPENTDAWLNKGDLLYNLQKHTEAIECFNKALDAHSKNTDFDDLDEKIHWNKRRAYMWYKKEEAFFNLKKNEEALSCINEALRLNDLDFVCWGIKGKILETFGKKIEAKKCFDREQKLVQKYG